jgi:hypothetical protein
VNDVGDRGKDSLKTGKMETIQKNYVKISIIYLFKLRLGTGKGQMSTVIRKKQGTVSEEAGEVGKEK